MTSKSSSKFGLRLTLPGAPEGVGHTVHGLTGVYYTDRIVPVGGEGEPSIEQARTAAEGPDAPIEVVEIKPTTKTADGGED